MTEPAQTDTAAGPMEQYAKDHRWMADGDFLDFARQQDSIQREKDARIAELVADNSRLEAQVAHQHQRFANTFKVHAELVAALEKLAQKYSGADWRDNEGLMFVHAALARVREDSR